MKTLKIKVTDRTDDYIALISNCYKSDEWLNEGVKQIIAQNVERIKVLEKKGILNLEIDSKMRKMLETE